MSTRSALSGGDQFTMPEAESLAPVYLVYGAEDLLVDETVQGLVEVAVPAECRGFNLDVLQGADADVRDVIARASAFPMMGDRRAVIVRDVDRFGPKELDLLAMYVSQPSPSTLLVLTALKPDMRRKAFALVKKSGNAVECKQYTESQLPGWITRRAKLKGSAIEQDACRLLSSLVGRSMRELDHELDKLISFAGERNVVTVEDVSVVVGVTRQYNIFEFQRSIGSGETRKAIEILNHLLEAGNGAPYIVVMLTSYFTTLWKMHALRRKGFSSDQIAAELKRERWALAEYFTALEHYSVFQVERSLGLLLAVDERSKSGGDAPSLLHTMLVEVMEYKDPISVG